MLVISWALDTGRFLMDIYRSDVRSFGEGATNAKEFIMTEAQFTQLEEFCKDEMRKLLTTFNTVAAATAVDAAEGQVSVKTLLHSLRDRL
mmetsp:Transcript_44287/g.58770  ORF Transcript_44287/g.58770 Transcript_44287/m.58770 type:complete len:90 (-) Transcript_44287:444-713(-)